MNHYVYEITNNINGMKYIGKRSCHCEIEKDSYMGSGKILKKAKEEFGQENFSKIILAVADDAEMALDLESYYIERRNAVDSPMYYNQVYGGDISHMFKHKDIGKQERVRKIIAEKNKGTNAGENSKVARKVICLNTKEVFVSGAEASSKYGLSRSAVSRSCNSKNSRVTAGIDPVTKERLRWMHYDTYLKEVEDGSIEKRYKTKISNYRKRVICLNTKEIFASIADAEKKYDAHHISTACKKGSTSGYSYELKENLKWMYYDDYIELNKENKNE